MAVVVQKFGGSSVATAERIKAAARRAIRAKQAGNHVLMVVSARGDTTDDLIALAQEISEQPPAREMDQLLSTGEQISVALMAMAIHELGEPAISFTGVQIGIQTDSTHTKARIRQISTERMRAALRENKIAIVAGFQGVDDKYDITTLGRGGSDTTAVALAAALKHDTNATAEEKSVECEIYTDVDGIYTTDPRLVPEARKMDAISYDEMLELASMGAGVMHSRSIEFAKKYDVPLMVRSSFSDAEGTWIVPETEWMRQVAVCGVAIAKDETRVLIDGVPDKPGVSHRIFSAIATANIAVDMIGQSYGSGGKASIGFTVLRNDLNLTLAILKPLVEEMGAAIRTDGDVSKVSIVGTGMRSHTGVAEKMFAALAAEGVNMKMITTGDIKISVLVDKADGARALKAVHQAFGLQNARTGAGLEGDKIIQEFKARPDVRGMDAVRDLANATSRLTGMEDIVISGVSLDETYGRITVSQLPDKPGNCSKIFEAVAKAGISVETIVQNLTAVDQAEISFTVPKSDLQRALIRTQDTVRGIDAKVGVAGDSDVAVLFVYGVGMRTHTGVARAMFGALAAKGINISLITTSEVCVSVMVELNRGKEALACLKEAFKVP